MSQINMPCTCAVFELDGKLDKVRCKLCFSVNPSKARWLAWKSAQQHLDSEDHTRHCDAIAKQRQLDEDERRKREVVYASNYVNLDPMFLNPVPPQKPQMSGFEDADAFVDTEYMGPIIPTFIEPIVR